MTLKETDLENMSEPVKEFINSPEEFLTKNDKNVVITTIVSLSENQSDTCDYLVLLAKCMKVYPNCWHYVRRKFCPNLPPFRRILEQNDDKIEPPSKRRKTGKFNDIYSKKAFYLLNKKSVSILEYQVCKRAAYSFL